ncbi:MAG TPA: glycosyltransferase family 61 protein, partial [Roseomonas sp.]|nr:glycosyltransferase family 61 protein [Roseomonas sp.]
EREHRIIERPLRVARLAVPDMGFVARRFLHPRQAAALAVHPFRTPEPGRRVWLSRLLLPAALAHVEGEAEIEASLAARGWTILRPETLSIPEQLAALEAAAVIAGIEGSAFHSLVLGRGVRARIVIFDRGRRINPNFELVADAKGLDQRAVSLQLDHLRGEGVRASYRLARPEEALAALDAAGDGLGEGTDEHEAG